MTFSDTGFARTTDPMTNRDDGPCHVNVARMTGQTTQASAGSVTISDGSDSFVLAPLSTDQYPDDQFAGLRYAAGDTISLAAAGATVPAFTGTVTFPADVAVTSPTSSVTTLSQAAGLAAAWAPTSGSVHVVITQYPSSTLSIGVDCAYAGDAGSGDIPPTALTDLIIGTSANVLVAGEGIGSAMAGDYAVEFLAAEYAFTGGVTVEP
jgi:hypothetical protein